MLRSGGSAYQLLPYFVYPQSQPPVELATAIHDHIELLHNTPPGVAPPSARDTYAN